MTLARHLMVDFNQMKTFVEDPLVLDRGEGIRVTDTAGRTYIDGLSGVFTSNLGHGNTEIIEAVTAQLGQLAFGAPTMATTSDGPRARRSHARVRAAAVHDDEVPVGRLGGDRVGDEAGPPVPPPDRPDGTLQDPVALPRLPRRHGHALAASGWPNWKIPFEPMAPGFVHLHTPDPDSPPTPVADDEAAARLYLELVRETIEFEGPDTVAAIITEPILMSAGVVVPPDAYLRGLRDLCDRYGILLIFDEIITGFGRTGTWFAAQHSGAWPDIICCGKGVTGGYSPLSIVLMTDKVAAPFWGDAGGAGSSSSRATPTAATRSRARRRWRRSTTSSATASSAKCVENGAYLRAQLEGAPRLPPEHPADSGPRPPAGHRLHRRSAGGDRRRAWVRRLGRGPGSGAGPARPRIAVVRRAGPAARVDASGARGDRRDPGRSARRHRVQDRPRLVIRQRMATA